MIIKFRAHKNKHFELSVSPDWSVMGHVINMYLQSQYEEIVGHQQPVLNLVFQAQQLLEHNKADFTEEQLKDLDNLVTDIKKKQESVSLDCTLSNSLHFQIHNINANNVLPIVTIVHSDVLLL